MTDHLDLPTPPDVFNRRRLAAMEHLTCILVTALMNHVDDKWTEADLNAEVLWALTAEKTPPESLVKFVRFLADLI